MLWHSADKRQTEADKNFLISYIYMYTIQKSLQPCWFP
jgi:hypothetical protein